MIKELKIDMNVKSINSTRMSQRLWPFLKIFKMDLMDPWSFSGPMRAQIVIKSPSAKIRENPMVLKTKTPNCTKNNIFAPSINKDAPTVVTAPERTDIPTSVKVSLILSFRPLCSDLPYPSARCTT